MTAGDESRSLHLLVVEDDAGIRGPLSRSLHERGHVVTVTATGLEGLRHALADTPDVVLLDLGLPDIDGVELLRMLRAVSDVPVVVMTARDNDESVVRTLDAGADDYLVKPFSVEQLEARVRAVRRRTGSGAARPEPVVVGGLRIDSAGRIAELDGTRLELTRKEFDLLAALAARAGQVVSKRELASDVWGDPYGSSDKTVDVHLSWLRRKLGETAARPRYIHAVRGVGVKLVDPRP